MGSVMMRRMMIMMRKKRVFVYIYAVKAHRITKHTAGQPSAVNYLPFILVFVIMGKTSKWEECLIFIANTNL